MVNYCFALPVLPGEVEAVKKFSEQNTNTKEHDEFYKIAGVTREHAWLQRSPPNSGAPDLEILSMETTDPGHMFKEFVTSSHTYAIKFREFAKKVYGVDFTGPPPPLNENIVDWRQK